MSIFDELTCTHSEMKSWFDHLHQYPELAFEEYETAKYIADLLESWGYDVVTGIGKTGVVASMTCGDGRGSIALRADMDALPMQEAGKCDVNSQVEGVSHMCGHDGHCTMLLGAAKHLAETRNFNGTLRLIFQPAEEPMEGALAMMSDGMFERFPVDAVFGIHNIPGLDAGKVYFHTGPVLTAVDNWEIELFGKGVHGSMPDKGIDPVVAGASLVMALQTIVSRNVAPTSTAVVTVGSFTAGTVGNIIPQSALLKLSVRSASPDVRSLVLDKIRLIAKAQAESFGVEYEIREGQPGAVLVNDSDLKEQCGAIALERMGDENVDLSGPSQMASEDFAFYAQRIPGFYAFIGNGETHMNHHPAYEFNQANFIPGAAYWVAIAEGLLK